MKLRLVILLAFLIIFSSSGCANGPFRRFFRGGACNTCNPPFGLFNRRQHTVDNCESGVCGGVTPVDGAMIGGPTFGTGTLPPPQPANSNLDTYPYPGTGAGTGTGLGGTVLPNMEPPLPGVRNPSR